MPRLSPPLAAGVVLLALAVLATPAASRTKELVLAVRIGDARKPYPLETFHREPVINDRVGATNVVVLGKPETRPAATS